MTTWGSRIVFLYGVVDYFVKSGETSSYEFEDFALATRFSHDVYLTTYHQAKLPVSKFLPGSTQERAYLASLRRVVSSFDDREKMIDAVDLIIEMGWKMRSAKICNFLMQIWRTTQSIEVCLRFLKAMGPFTASKFSRRFSVNVEYTRFSELFENLELIIPVWISQFGNFIFVIVVRVYLKRSTFHSFSKL